ncbi:Protein arginine N-methyltransferase 1 [Sphaceloma murrayae]|uniref:L-ornithine N(5)-monooxygenase [NAD(P)H] n=1 Tax=Sphaceloma murrayae TaxID=2082308 RepID=A0A2K1QPY3_9PEZI|nr:Protein arginine N-methyltransferase 1 [Sphaceloma murrayae]
MTPHATYDYPRSPSARSSSVGSASSASHSTIGPSPYLRRVASDELHDLICVGFGPASLAIAVALHDSFSNSSSGQNASALPKVSFLERQPNFAWHAGMQIPGAKMQISFLKDLATLRDPRSEFTFMNYLHRNKRLTQFSNVGTFLPRRLEYEAYMRWCASAFEDCVNYNTEVLSVDPDTSASSTKPVRTFTITSRNVSTGDITSLRTKHVLIAVGGRPKIPTSLPQSSSRVIHSSQYRRFLSSSSLPTSSPLRIAVIGGGQSAAEIFSDIPNSFPNSTSMLLIKSSALRPSDDSPFVNEIFDPERVDGIYATPAQKREAQIMQDKATNYGVVRIELLEHIYEELYTQRVTIGNEESEWPRRIMANRIVEGAEERGDEVVLKVRGTDEKGSAVGEAKEMRVDLVFVASGYERDMHEKMLEGCRGLAGGKKFEVQRDYSVRFEEGRVADDAGVWLQGCNEKTHGLSDTLLSILAVRGGEIVGSIFGR